MCWERRTARSSRRGSCEYYRVAGADRPSLSSRCRPTTRRRRRALRVSASSHVRGELDGEATPEPLELVGLDVYAGPAPGDASVAAYPAATLGVPADTGADVSVGPEQW